MSCERCGAPCQSRRCRGCEQIDSNEARHGDCVDRDDGDEWQVEQTGLDGHQHEGQATLDGGVAKDGGEQ